MAECLQTHLEEPVAIRNFPTAVAIRNFPTAADIKAVIAVTAIIDHYMGFDNFNLNIVIIHTAAIVTIVDIAAVIAFAGSV